MAKNYTYKEQKVTTKKLIGFYNATTNIISVNVDDNVVDKNIMDELQDFDGAFVEFSIKVKEENDLTEEV